MPVDIPILGSRTAVWIAAQLHLFFAAFVLGAPIFIVVAEILGMRTGDARYERLARETMKVVAMAYSVTALMGGLFAFLLMGPYADFSGYIVGLFFPLISAYAVLIVLETLLMYAYWYSWDALSGRKGLHVALGILLNLVGTLVMVLMNAVAAYMLTPPEAAEQASLWQMVNNPSWTGLNLHRFIGNLTFGGFMVALFAATMFLTSQQEGERAFYDWMGFTGNFIGVGTLLVLPVAGYIYAKELFLYDASISTLLMADKLAWFFELQGVLVSLLFLGANYYMWLSIRRISGGERFARPMRLSFAGMLAGTAIWITPQVFLPDLTSQPGAGLSITELALPERLAFLGLMMAKALAVTAIILLTFLTFLFYRRALRTGRITWGQIDPRAQYALIFLPAVAVYTMGLMGAIRELARQDFHVYQLVRDLTPYWYIPSLGYVSLITGVVTLLFFLLMGFLFWLGFMVAGAKERQG